MFLIILLICIIMILKPAIGLLFLAFVIHPVIGFVVLFLLVVTRE